MNTVNNLLVKADRLFDYVPIISTATNLVDLFHKTVVFPLMDKTKIASNQYYKHLDQKSFLRCFLLIIPVIGNIVIGIYDFSKKSCNHPSVDKVNLLRRIDKTNISLDDVESIVVGGFCRESSPCQHKCTIFLKDGSTTQGLNSFDICSIISKISEERINPGEKWKAKDVKEHFCSASKNYGWELDSPENVLKNYLF